MKKITKKRLTNIILVAILLVGLSLLLYPSVSDYWNSFHQTRAIMRYMEEVGSMDSEEYDRVINSAHAYNAAIDPTAFRWFLSDDMREVYQKELNFNNDGAMGFVTIDKINVSLPIYPHRMDQPSRRGREQPLRPVRPPRPAESQTLFRS